MFSYWEPHLVSRWSLLAKNRNYHIKKETFSPQIIQDPGTYFIQYTTVVWVIRDFFMCKTLSCLSLKRFLQQELTFLYDLVFWSILHCLSFCSDIFWQMEYDLRHLFTHKIKKEICVMFVALQAMCPCLHCLSIGSELL